jgi:hypothetical protein
MKEHTKKKNVDANAAKTLHSTVGVTDTVVTQKQIQGGSNMTGTDCV